MASATPHGVTQLLLAWNQGEQSALEKLIPRGNYDIFQVHHPDFKSLSQNAQYQKVSRSPESTIEWLGRQLELILL